MLEVGGGAAAGCVSSSTLEIQRRGMKNTIICQAYL